MLLEERYCQILADLPETFLSRCADATGRLSSPFLVSEPGQPDGRKIMVIGRECGWNWRVKYAGGGAQAYVPAALALHREKFRHWMAGTYRGATFFGFLQAIARKLGSAQGLIYSNLFCFDWGGRDPRGCKEHYRDVIEPLSARLLKAQIDHFQPDLIIFANGIDSADVRRRIFPHDKGVVDHLRDWAAAPDGIANGQLWAFELNGKYRCLRIQHPSAYNRPAIQAREFLVNHLLEPLQCTVADPDGSAARPAAPAP